MKRKSHLVCALTFGFALSLALTVEAEPPEKRSDPTALIQSLQPMREKLGADDLMRLARAYRAKNDAASEVTTLELLVSKQPKNLTALLQLAEAYSHAGRKDDAFDKLQQALKMNPKSKEVLKGLAREHEKAGEFYEARSRIEDVVKFHGSSAETRAWLCRLYSREHLLNKSAESCLVAVDADPGQADAYLFLATSFRDLEKPDKALITLKRAQARFPKLEPAFTLAGEIHLAEKRVDPAYSAFKRALSIDPNSSKANLGFAEAALLLGQYSEALKTYEHLCTIDKSNNREFRSAYIKLRSQRNQEWEAKFERALEDCQ